MQAFYAGRKGRGEVPRYILAVLAEYSFLGGFLSMQAFLGLGASASASRELLGAGAANPIAWKFPQILPGSL